MSATTLPGLRLTAAVLLLASMTVMANATIAPALPGLRAHFANVPGIDTLAGLILTLPSAAIVLSAGIFGWMADRLDRQKLLLLAAALYAIGGTSGLWATDLTQLLIGRGILGVGVAGTMTLALAWGADLWQGEARARFLGIQGAAMSAGGIVVMLLGGALSALHWRGAFGVYVLILPVALLALTTLAPHARARQTSLAARPALNSRAPVERFPWAAFAIVGPLAFLFMAAFYVMPTRLPFLLEHLGVSNAMLVGMIMATMTLAALPGALAYGRIRRFLSAMTVFAVSYVLMGAGMLVIASAQGVGAVVLGSVLAGLGMGPSMPNYTTYFMGFVQPGQRGRASGLLTTAFFAGQFASPLVSAPLVAAFGLRGAFSAFGLGLIGLGLVLGLATRLQQRRAAFAG